MNHKEQQFTNKIMLIPNLKNSLLSMAYTKEYSSALMIHGLPVCQMAWKTPAKIEHS